MIKIKKIKRTCFACPSQWEGYTIKNQPVYIRYRYGFLAAQIGKSGENIADALDGKYIFCAGIGHMLSGYMPYDELKEILKDKVRFPNEET